MSFFTIDFSHNGNFKNFIEGDLIIENVKNQNNPNAAKDNFEERQELPLNNLNQYLYGKADIATDNIENIFNIINEIYMAQQSNEYFKFAEEVASLLRKKVSIFKSDKYDDFKNLLNDLSKVDEKLEFLNNIHEPESRYKFSEYKDESLNLKKLGLTKDILKTLNEFRTNIESPKNTTPTIAMSELINNVSFLINLKDKKLRRDAILTKFNLATYENYEFAFNSIYKKLLEDSITDIKDAIKNNFGINEEKNILFNKILVDEDLRKYFAHYVKYKYLLSGSYKRKYDKSVDISSQKYYLIELLNLIQQKFK